MLNTLTSGLIQAVHKKQQDCMWLWVGISLLLYRLRTWSKCQKTWQTCSLHSKKIFAWGVRIFCG